MSRIPRIPIGGTQNQREVSRLLDRVRQQETEFGADGIEVFNTPVGRTVLGPGPAQLECLGYGIIMASGPNQEDDWIDSRYWVTKAQFVQTAMDGFGAPANPSPEGNLDPNTPANPAAPDEGDFLVQTPFPTATMAEWFVVATNLAELNQGPQTPAAGTNSAVMGTHLLAPGECVRVWTVYGVMQNSTNVDAYQQYVFERTPPANALHGVIKAITGVRNGSTGGYITWNPYTVSLSLGNTVNMYCAQELAGLNGTPGVLGVNVSSTGNVDSGSCYVQPPGVGAPVDGFYNNTASQYQFNWLHSAAAH